MKNRNYGIDLLRIISMMLIAMLHVLGQGGILISVKTNTLSYQLVWILETLAYSGVNIYALISGYVGIDSKFKYKSIVKLTLEVMFYTIIITLLFKIFSPDLVSTDDIVKSFFPYAFNHYWYFTAYFGMFFFIPFMQKLVNSFNEKDAKKFIITVFMVFTILPIIFRSDIYQIEWGYHVLWLSLLYIIGACIKKFGFNKRIENNLVKTFILCNAITILGKIGMEYVLKIATGTEKLDLSLVSYTSPTILLSAITLVLIFAKFDFKEKSKKIITLFAPLSFAVYLIHTEPLIWNNWLKAAFVHYTTYNSFVLVLLVIVTALGIYIVCSLIEYIRVLLFKLLKINERIDSFKMPDIKKIRR